jgi:hypothetical protein
MNEREMGRELLRGEAAIDPHILADRVLQRDRRRMWGLGARCVVAWMLVVMLPWATVLPMTAKIVSWQEDMTRGASGDQQQEQQASSTEMLQAVKLGTMSTFFGSIASMFVAATSTVALIVFSRRATLRQINNRLAEIVEKLQPAAASAEAP